MPDSKDSSSVYPAQSEFSSAIIEILIVAENSTVKEIVSILDRAGWQYNWQQATTEEDLYLGLDDKLDLILFDPHTKDISRSQIIDLLSKSDRHIPWIVVNGEFSIPAAVAAIKAGASDYIPSEELTQLPQAIAKVLCEPNFLCLQSDCATHTEQQLRKLITENADGILVVDEGGIVQFVNPSALELLGKSNTELIGQDLGFPVVNGDFLEVDIPLNRDRILVAQMRVSQIQWQASNAFVVSLRDITQLKQAEEERAKLLEQAQAANRAKDEFLAILSHELRTPLNPIVGWSQLLLRGNFDPAKTKKGAEIIYRNAMLQTELIGDILDISRLIQGKLKLEAEPVNLADIIENALETVELAAQAKSIDIRTHIDQDVGLVQGDPTRLQQVVWNLLANAVKFTPDGGKVDVILTTKTDKLLTFAQIEIQDSGRGIPAEFLPHIFDYFSQQESTKSRSEGGLGLGLAIVRRLVELHGGQVSASSPGVGQGASFIVSLPIFKTGDRAMVKRSPQTERNLSGLRILIVDDEDDSRYLISFILETEGAQIYSAKSSTEALSIIGQFDPHILISDIGMPKINGYEMIERIRQLQSDRERKVKAIAVSGYASDQDRERSLNAGFDHHLNKPIDIEALIELLV